MNDSQNVTLYGINNVGERTILVDGLSDYTANLSNINAIEFPYLDLVYNVQDSIDLTAASLDYWRVYYTPLPEAVINPNGESYTFNSPLLSKGELLTLDYDVKNISNIDMSEILVNYNIVGQNNESITWQQRYDVLPNNSEDSYGIEFNTNDLPSGKYDLQVSINPDDDQPELYFFNNVGVLKFEIAGNDLNPLLDVTFDEIRIENGDVVSPLPEIQVTLSDDNPYLLLEDRNLFELELTYPDGTQLPIDLNGPTIEFIPATAGGEINQAKLIFTPTLEAGDYTLTVQAEDNAGNASGDYNYMVNFIVVTESRITNFTNYPNPFSGSTRFVFNATGDDLPKEFELIIFNDIGQAVKKVTQDEFLLRVGRDRTYYTWNGTSDAGNELPNGIYYYRLFIDKDESIFYDKDFAKGYGKLVIVN